MLNNKDKVYLVKYSITNGVILGEDCHSATKKCISLIITAHINILCDTHTCEVDCRSISSGPEEGGSRETRGVTPQKHIAAQ